MGPRPRAYGSAAAAAARTSASAVISGWATSWLQSAWATAVGRVEPARPRPSGGVEPSNGSGTRRIPATTAASRTAAATCSARRARPCAACATIGSNGSAASGEASGPAASSRPVRASCQFSAAQSTASAA